MLALFLAAFIGPGQVSPDLANNALSLYLARPFSRVEYVLGKMWILIVLMSLMTWVPGLLLFSLQAYLEEGWTWMQANSSLAVGLFFGSWVWLLVLALMALALSAWVKWKPAAGALMFGVFFVAAGFGVAINGVQRTTVGTPVQHQRADRLHLGAPLRRRPGGQQRRASSSACRRARNCRCGAAGRRWRCSAWSASTC